MRAFIFAAGMGTRLKPFTEYHPKALVPVGGVPMLERVIVKLKNSGIEDFVINVHHFASQILDFLKSNNDFGVNITISDESSKLLDTGGALLHAEKLFSEKEPILIHNADILTDFDIREMLAFHNAHNADATLLVAHRNSSRQLYFEKVSHRLYGWKNLNTGASIPKDFSTLPDFDNMAFGGVHIITRKVLDELCKYATSDVFPIIPFYLDAVNKLNIIAYTPQSDYTWFDIGKPETLASAENFLKNLHK